MEVFLSWSGNFSKKLAEQFRDWLPLVLQDLDPFMSDRDLLLGSRWNESINKHLDSSSVGLLIVTPDNISSPWLNYEAGALTKALKNETKIIPIIFGNEEPSTILVDSPLKQFQSVTFPDRNGIFKLIENLNSNLDDSLNEDSLRKTFDKWWPEVDKSLEKISKDFKNKGVTKKSPNDSTSSKSNSNNMSNELLVRVAQNVDALLRENQHSNFGNKIDSSAYLDLYKRFNLLKDANFVSNLSSDDVAEYNKLLRSLYGPINYILHKSGIRPEIHRTHFLD